MLLFFDTETTGLPKNWKLPITNFDNWPRLVQLAWIVSDNNGNIIDIADYIIKPDNFIIPQEASNIHKITTERAMKEGEKLEIVLKKLNCLIEKSKYIIAHNINFDEKILSAEFLRLGMQNSFINKMRICTMKYSTDFCKIPGYYGYKWPTLSELHMSLFNFNFEEAHNASVDISITYKCFWELKKRGIIKLDY